MSITSKFIKAFDPKDQEHVTWLGFMCDLAESMGDPSNHMHLLREVNKNPMKIKLEQRDALDWPHIHFVLCASYAKAVLSGRAFIPSPSA
jgi:hypothetical protein